MSYNELKQHGTVDFPIEIYQVDKTNTKYEMASHWHTQLEIIRILKGTLNTKLNNQGYIAKKGDIIFINPETVHGAYPVDCVYECIVFHMEFLEIADHSCKFFIDSLINQEYIIKEFHKASNSPFYNSVNNIFEAMNHKSSGYKFKVIGAIYQMLGIIIDEHLYSSTNTQSQIQGDKNVPKLKSVLFFIRENFDKPITLDDMALSAGMSSKYFCYFFREMTGKTPVEYLNSYRIEKASRKLLNTDLSVTDIAFLCGFNDLSYFIKTFKKIKGITPRKFRKS